jgi:UDP-N-acetylmuramate dehydrogenase
VRSATDTGSEARPAGLRTGVPLAPLTTLDLGGPARHLLEVRSAAEVREGLAWARARGLEVAVLGGGSNVVVADRGFDGLVLKAAGRGLEVRREAGAALVQAAAGEPWDELVAQTVAEGLAGLECLSGIPGSAGATPIQNVGAYGQEVGPVIDRVRVLDLGSGVERVLAGADCGFAYRSSRFRTAPGRFIVLEVAYRLRPGGAPTVAYEELQRALAVRTATPGLAAVREAVLELRRAKSMVLDPDDANRRSVGSFFLNPVVETGAAAAVEARARACGALAPGERMPRFASGDGHEKLSAAWLIERAGFSRGLRRGAVGLSSRHALALVHHGGGSAAELIALARDIRDRVEVRFGVTLRPEPVFLGFDTSQPFER